LADIFTEVDEDLRRDRVERLWKAYGRYVIAAAVLAVLGTGAWTAWTDWQRSEAAAETRRLLDAIDQAAVREGDPATLAGLQGLGRDGRPGPRALARLYEAGLKARSGDLPAALALYRAVAADGAVDPDLRDAAQLLAALVGSQTLAPAEIDAQLGRLAAADSPWRFTAQEIAALAALRAGENARARDLYARVADDPGAPPSLRARAAEMLQAIGG
jgi:hypothetical protein